MSQLVGLGGLEPPTSRLSGVRSNQLSYRPISVELRVFTDLSKPNNDKCVSTASAYATSTYSPKCRPK